MFRTPNQALAEQYKSECSSSSTSGGGGDRAPPLFPAGEALSLLDAHASGIADERDRAAFWTTVSDLAKVLLQVCVDCWGVAWMDAMHARMHARCSSHRVVEADGTWGGHLVFFAARRPIRP